MNIVYFGTPVFSAEVLRFLVEQGINPVAVVTQPDRPQGRGERLRPPAVKAMCDTLGLEIPIFQPEKASDPGFAPHLQALNPDLFVVVAYGEIIKEHLLNMPSRACINLHTSLLPKYRGAAPIQRCIMNGEQETGVTIMHMAKKMDAGDIIAVEKLPVPEEMTAGELERDLCAKGSELLFRVIQEFEKGTPLRIPQDHSLATLAPKVHPEDGEVSWSLPAKNIHDQVRGLTPRPGAWCRVRIGEKEKRLKLLKTAVLDGQFSESVGEFFFDKSTGVAGVSCQGSRLVLLEVQLEGKRAMSGADFLRGYGSQVNAHQR